MGKNKLEKNPLEKNDWKKFEKKNLAIALNVLYAKKEKNIPCLCFKTSEIVRNNFFF